MEIIAQFTIPYYQFLNRNGAILEPLPSFAQEPKNLLALYRHMLLTRTLDAKAVNLQRMGKMGTYPSALGQEAIGTGVGFALHPKDVLVPYYRDQAAMLQHGVTMTEILNYWGGDERANHYQNSMAQEDFPIAIPVGSQCLHAVGVAYAIQYRAEERAVVCGCGDGGTSKGDFYEALNFAGIKKLPVVFVINNNQWAISVPRSAQTAALTIAQKAIAAGIPGIQVDGNDVIAVQHVVDQALIKARQHQGPTLIEAVSYRLCDHTTADNAKRYCDEKSLQAAWQYEPLLRLQKFLLSQNIITTSQIKSMETECTTLVDEAIASYLNTPAPAPVEMFDYLYDKLPLELIEQRQQLL